MADPAWWHRPLPRSSRFGHLTFEEIEGPEEAAALLARRAEVEAGPPSPLQEVGRLAPPLPAQALLTASVGPHGELVALWCDATDEERFVLTDGADTRNWLGARASRSAPMSITVDTVDGGRTTHVRVQDVELSHPIVCAAPDGRFAIVSRVCELRDDVPDLNGVVLDAHGTVLDRVMLGDGANDVQTTPSGRTWVGYTDTGIFGNNGWGVTGREGSAGRQPVGSLGCVRFDTGWAVEWEFGRAWWEARLPDRITIDHVFSLNLIDETAWLYVSASEYAVARVVDDDIRIWNSDVANAQHLLVGDDRVALIGGYGPEYDRVVIGLLGATDVRVGSIGRLVLPEGRDLPLSARMAARGSTLHVVVGDRWYRLDI